ncbi:MAG: hypothetical protein GF398_07055, partial [Chitinivibrionales bacterium]|nr:hypothetical protein [Chitinivibrionales bacterium]
MCKVYAHLRFFLRIFVCLDYIKRFSIKEAIYLNDWSHYMATPIAMPRQGQSVETCVINEWLKKKGDEVNEGDVLFSYETDKATFEYESEVAGTLLDIFFDADADVAVLTNVAVVGDPGEEVEEFRPKGEGAADTRAAEPAPAQPESAPAPQAAPAAPEPAAGSTPSQAAAPAPVRTDEGILRVSPRARKKAAGKGVDVNMVGGTGAKGRIIEADIDRFLSETPQMTSAAAAKQAATGMAAPAAGTGLGGRVRAADLFEAAAAGQPLAIDDTVAKVKQSKMRRIIGRRMMQSLQQTAQLTINASANATSIMAYRKQIKINGEKLGLAN